MPTKQTTYLNAGWEFIETPKEASSQWLKAEVPGHVHLDLMQNGIINDPFYRMQEAGVQWVDLTDWSYRCRFIFEPDKGLPHRVLRFEGLDTIATISLNGEVIGSHDNMHTAVEIDVSKKLKEGENEIRVDFASAVRVGEERKAVYFEKHNVKPNTVVFLERSFVRKAQYMYGWDWGPRLVSCGIWRPVALVEYASRITNVHVVAEPSETEDVWNVKIQSELLGKGELRHVIFDADFEVIAELDGDGVVQVENPELWWPHDMGEPYLYRVLSVLNDSDVDVDDTVATTFGFRTVKLVQEEDLYGTSFEFEINGVPIWARGANWIPDHSFPSVVDARQYRIQLQNAVDMNMNMIRVWGGGLVETDEFFEAADEMGLLIWQDFAYGCQYVPDTDEWLDVARLETIDNVKRLRNHPSLVHWCGNNENLMIWDKSWGGADRKPDRYYGENIYDKVIPQVLAEFDPTRPYTPSSPWGGMPCSCDPIGDQHNWDVWHGGDWVKYTESRGRFVSEFGFASSCSLDLWQNTIDTDDWSHDSPVVRWHDKTGKNLETFEGYVKLHYPQPDSLEDWVYYSQLNQRDALRHGIEHYRSNDFCKGTLVWQINDCWPVQSWALIDSEGNWKAAAHEMRRVFADQLVSITREGSKVKVFAVNDGQEAIEDSILVAYVKSTVTGDVLKSVDVELTIDSGERTLAVELDIEGLPAPETIIEAQWIGYAHGWRFVCEPKEVRFSNPVIKFGVDASGQSLIQSDFPVVDLMLFDESGSQAFLDNFVTLLDTSPAPVDLVDGAQVGQLIGRSLAGYHKIRVVRGPF